MRHKLILPLTLLLTTAAAIAETTAPDSQLTQSMLAEVRQLRNDLQIAAATVCATTSPLDLPDPSSPAEPTPPDQR